jgi:hypothetical protein
VALLQPASLEGAVKFARAYEQRLGSSVPSTQPKTSARPSTRLSDSAPATAMPSVASSLLVDNKSTTTLKLTPAEVAERHHKNQCFHCNEQYVYDHMEQCKQLFTIEVITEEGMAQLTADDPTISLHVLTGIQPRSGRTMQVTDAINGFLLMVLLDSVSNHNFVDTATTVWVGLALCAYTAPTSPLPMATASTTLAAAGICTHDQQRAILH